MANDICVIPGCGSPLLARGWCAKHYQRWRNYGDPNHTPPASRMRDGSKPTRFVVIGQRFGRWVVVNPEVRVSRGRRGAIVKCSCPRGTEKAMAFADLFSGNSKSCGCLRGEVLARRNREANPAITHGMTYHPLFHTWKKILSRCDNPSDKDWPNYGGRGIAVCPQWRDLVTFIGDIESSIGPRPEGKYPSGMPLYTLDRIDNEAGNYEPGKVRWATATVQRQNRRNRPRKQCACGNRNPARAKFCFECGIALPGEAPED